MPLLIGVAAALASTRIVSSLLFVTTPRDLAAFGTVAALTLLAALIATTSPIRASTARSSKASTRVAPELAVNRSSLTPPQPPQTKEDTFRGVLRWIFEDAVRSSEACRNYVEQDVAELLKAGRYFVLPRMVWPTVLDDDAWARLRVPCLFVVGENEKIYSPKAAVRRLRRVAPLVRAEIVPGAGHDLTMVQPDLVARKILEFLDEPVEAPNPESEESVREAVAES